jgi:GDPmannose 4,6-dehydratase
MKALIFGAGGQAGQYMTRFLNKKGYEVTALNHRDCNVRLYVDVCSAIIKHQPDEIYNFASLMNKEESWITPFAYNEANFLSVLYILIALWESGYKAKFFQAGSAEMFDSYIFPQKEDTPINPTHPYGAAKAAAYHYVKMYREEKNLFACTGILFNMESPLRDSNCFSRKVAKGVAAIASGKQTGLILGNLAAVRDWGLVEEYVEAMWMMLQQDTPTDYVIGTGVSASCRDFVEEACNVVDISFENNVSYMMNYNIRNQLQSCPDKIYNDLGWAAKTDWKGVVKHLVEAELNVQSPVTR